MSLLWFILRNRVVYTFFKYYNENFNKIFVVKILFFWYFLWGKNKRQKN